MDPIDPTNQFPDPAGPVYRHSIFRLGPTGLAVALVAIVFPIVGVLFLVGRPYPVVPVLAAVMWALFLAFILLGPVIHYYRPSPFEQGRQRMAAYGGTANFKMGNYPARLLIYLDGLEIRAMYSAYFIPFDKMDEPQRGSFFMPGALIQSNLSQVPNRIRFFSFSKNQEIVEKITNLRMSHLGAYQEAEILEKPENRHEKFGLTLICLLLVSCAGRVDHKSYVELPGDKPGGERVFPYAEGRSCASGDYDHFTIRQLTDFGERPVWRHDGQKLAFVDHEFGDAFEYDFETGDTACITCDFDHPGFLRVHYMKDGDYLLLGPKKRGNDLADRIFKTGFFWMLADRSIGPRWIGEEHFDGVAVSRESRQIAYAKTWLDSPGHLLSALYVAQVTMDGRIVDPKAVFHSPHIIEAQDFLPGDSGVTMARYTPTYEAVGYIFGADEYVNYSKSPATEEPEGLFPDGNFTMIESDRHARESGDMDLELYMLRLDGTGKDVRRLTHFTDTPGEKASNPAVSPEGCRIAFMKGKKTQDPNRLTGLGDGLFLIEFYMVVSGE